MAVQNTKFDEDEIYYDENCIAENDLKKLKEAHVKVIYQITFQY